MASYGTAPNQVGYKFNYNNSNPGAGAIYTVPAGSFAQLYVHLAPANFFEIRKNGLTTNFTVNLAIASVFNPTAGIMMGPGDQLWSTITGNRNGHFTVIETISAA